MSPQAGQRPDPTLAALLKRLREQREISQEQLAWEAGITVAALSRIERALAVPTWVTVNRLLAALGVSLSQLAHQLEQAQG